MELLGDDTLAWLVLALGGALLVGNLLALLRPPPATKEAGPVRAPIGRSLMMALLGLVASVWALGTLVAG